MPAVADRPRSARLRRLVVIGNGMAGARAVEEILARGGGALFEITMFGDEPHGNYNRTLLGRVLAGQQEEADIVLNSLSWYRENNITLHAGVRVDRVDKYSKHVFAGDGRVVPYDVLTIATGSRPYLPPMDGLYAPSGSLRHGVFTFRTMDDARRMAWFARQEGCRRALVIGGGLPGVEAARGLRSRGMEVAVVRSGGGAAAILGKDRITGVRLGGQAALDCDMVVVAAGTRPNVDLAVLSALAVERAIVVDERLRVMDEEDIHAVGECVQYRGEIYSLVAPLWEQAAVLADHLTGADRAAAYLGSGRSLLPASRTAPRIQ